MNKILLFLTLIPASLAYGMEERAARIQANPGLLFPEAEVQVQQGRALAFAMALHPRLGADSPAHLLPRDLVQSIACLATNENVAKWLAQNQGAIDSRRHLNEATMNRQLYNAPSLNLARIFLYCGADPNTINGVSLLWDAANNGNDMLVQILLNAGADHRYVDDMHRQTPLHRAAYWGHHTCAEILLKAGTNPDAIGKWGHTPLHFAAQEGHEAVVATLLAAHADPQCTVNGKSTPLSLAVSRGHNATVKMLLCATADHLPHENLSRLLLIAAGEGHSGIVQTLLSFGADPNAVDQNGRTALHLAARKGCRTTINILLDAGADPRAKVTSGPGKGNTAARIAMMNNHMKLATFLEDCQFAAAQREKEAATINEVSETATAGSSESTTDDAPTEAATAEPALPEQVEPTEVPPIAPVPPVVTDGFELPIVEIPEVHPEPATEPQRSRFVGFLTNRFTLGTAAAAAVLTATTIARYARR